MDIFHCENIYLPRFGSIEKHHVFKEYLKFLKGRTYSKSCSIDMYVTSKLICKLDVGFSFNSSFPSIVVLVNNTDAWKKSSKDHLVRPCNKRKNSHVVINEDENGYIICSTQKESD